MLFYVGGWQRKTQISLFDHVEYFYSRGLKYLKTTEINCDGTLVGPAFDLYMEILEKFPGICRFASGGVRHVADIERLNELGVYGVLFGKAYYEGKISQKELERFLVTV